MSWNKRKDKIKTKPFRRFDEVSYKTEISLFEWLVIIGLIVTFSLILYTIIIGLFGE